MGVKRNSIFGVFALAVLGGCWTQNDLAVGQLAPPPVVTGSAIAEAPPETAVVTPQGTVAEASSFQDVSAFLGGSPYTSGGSGEEIAQGTASAGSRTVRVAPNVLQAGHLGELDLIAASAAGKTLLLTIEAPGIATPFVSTPFLQVRKGASPADLAQSLKPLDLALRVPLGLDEKVPVLLLICADSNGNGACGDERIKNLNYFINQVDVREQANEAVLKDLSDLFTASALDGFDGAANSLVYYANAAMLDPRAQTLTQIQASSNGFLFATTSEDDQALTAATEAVQQVETLVQSAPAAISTAETAGNVRISISIPLYFRFAASPASEIATSGDDENLLGSEFGGTGGADSETASSNFGSSETGGNPADNGGETSGPSDEAGSEAANPPPEPAEETGPPPINGDYCDARCGCTKTGKMSCSDSRCESICGCFPRKKDPSDLGNITCQGRKNGCFAADTLILLPGKEPKPIRELKGENEAINARGETQSIASFVGGPELKQLLYFSTAAGHHIGVTVEHPMVTGRGLLKAADVHIGDTLARYNAAPERVVDIAKRYTSDFVYNFSLSGAGSQDKHLVVANGFVTGDLYLQQQLKQQPKAAVATAVSASRK